MFDHLKTVYEEQVLELPAINQEALKSFVWEKKLFEIAKKYGLHIDQTEDFWTETMLVLVGLEPAPAYEEKLMTELAVSPADATKITADVNTQIFGPIHDFIVRGGPLVASKNPTSAQDYGRAQQEPGSTSESLAQNDIHITEHEEPVKTEPRAPMSFSPLIQTGIVIPVSGGDTLEEDKALEVNMQKSVEALLDTPTPIPSLREDATAGKQEPNQEQSDDAVLSLESMLNGEVKTEVPAVQIKPADPVPSLAWTAPATIPTVSPIPISPPIPENQTLLREDATEGHSKRLSAIEKLQKMLAEEKATQTVITPSEKVDHSVGTISKS